MKMNMSHCPMTVSLTSAYILLASTEWHVGEGVDLKKIKSKPDWLSYNEGTVQWQFLT